MFPYLQNKLTNDVKASNYQPTEGLHLDKVTVFGVDVRPTTVVANGNQVQFTYDQTFKVSYWNLNYLSEFVTDA